MREIRYRVWDTFRNKMENDLQCFASFQDDGSVNCFNGLRDNILMLYTNVKDRNGIEICESDIILTNGKKYKVWFSGVAFGLIETNGDFYEYICNLSHLSGRAFEVIGNIYENPELLN